MPVGAKNSGFIKLENNVVIAKELLELSREQSFHETPPREPSPLDNVQVLIAGGLGSGLDRRLQEKNIRPLITQETEPVEPHAHGHKQR